MSGYLIGKTPYEHTDTGSCFSLPPEHNDLSPSSSLNVLIREFNQSNYASVLHQLSQQNNKPSQIIACEPSDVALPDEESSFPRIHRSRGGLYYEYPVHSERLGSQCSSVKPAAVAELHTENLIAEVGSVQELLDRMNIMIAKSRKRGRTSSRRLTPGEAGKVTGKAGGSRLSGYTTDCSVEDDALSLASVSSEFEYHGIHSTSSVSTVHPSSTSGGALAHKLTEAEKRQIDEVNAGAGEPAAQVAVETRPGELVRQQAQEDDRVKRVSRLQRAKTRVIRHAENKPQFPIDSASQVAVSKTATVTKSRVLVSEQSRKAKDGQARPAAVQLERSSFGLREPRAARKQPIPMNAYPTKIASGERSQVRRRAK